MMKHSSTSARRRSYGKEEKKQMVAEAKVKGIRVTARTYNVPKATLRVWMLKDFNDLPSTKKRLPGSRRSLKYDPSIDIALRDWVIQMMMVRKRVLRGEIRQKALELITPYNHNFQASQGWISRFLGRHRINLTDNTIGITVRPYSEGNGQQFMNNHNQQQSTTGVLPLVSYFTVNCEDNGAVNHQPAIEQEVIEDGLVPIEEDVEIISNCDIMDLEETVNANDMSSSTSEPSRSLTMHMPGTITQSPDTNCIEFTPLVDPSNLLPLHREDVKNHQPKPHRKKSYDQSVEIILKDWILQRTITEKRRVTHQELRKKAQEFILPYNPKFLASSAWIRNFLHRHKISLNAMVHKMEGTKSTSTKNKNDKASNNHRCTVKLQKHHRQKGHSHNQDGRAVLLEKDTRSSLGLERCHDFAPTQTSLHHLKRIGRPRELLNQDIQWKRMVLSIPKVNFSSQHISKGSKALRSIQSKRQKGIKKTPRKQPRKKIREVVNVASIVDGLLKAGTIKASNAARLPNINTLTTTIASIPDVSVKWPSKGASTNSKKDKIISVKRPPKGASTNSKKDKNIGVKRPPKGACINSKKDKNIGVKRPPKGASINSKKDKNIGVKRPPKGASINSKKDKNISVKRPPKGACINSKKDKNIGVKRPPKGASINSKKDKNISVKRPPKGASINSKKDKNIGVKRPPKGASINSKKDKNISVKRPPKGACINSKKDKNIGVKQPPKGASINSKKDKNISVKRPPKGACINSKKEKKSLTVPSSKKQLNKNKEQKLSGCKSWDIAKKRSLVAEAIQNGIRPTAQIHNMSFATLRVWTKQDFGDVPGNKKRLPGAGRPLKYDQSIDLALREWVLQKMGKGELITCDELKRKALEMILPCNPGFQASYGWFVRFLTRHNLTLNRSSRKKSNGSTIIEFQVPVSVKVEEQSPDSSQVDQHIPDFSLLDCPKVERQKKSKPSGIATTSLGKRQSTATTGSITVKRRKKQ